MKVLLTLIALFLGLTSGSWLFAQGGIRASVESQVESSASQILARNLPLESFQITAEVVIDEKKLPKLSLNPGATQENLVKSMSLPKLISLSTSVKLKIFVDETVSRKAKDQIQEILIKKMGLDLARGDSIGFTKLDLPTSSAQVKQELGKSDADLREIRLKFESLQKETLEKEKTIAELRAESRKSQSPETKKDSGNVPVEPSQLTQWAPLFLPLSILTIGLIAIAVFFLGNIRSANIVATAFTAIAGSIPKLGDKLNSQNEGVSQKTLTSIDKEGLTQEHGGDFKQRLFDLHDQLTADYSSTKRSFALQHITMLLRINPSPAPAVLLMEFLGQDKANELFSLMDAESQSRVLTYMQDRTPEPRKHESMIRLGEELKTLLILHSMQNTQLNRDSDLAVLIGRLDDHQRQAMTAFLSEPALGRYLSYFTPQEISSLLSRFELSSSTSVLDALAKLPNYAELSNEDASIQAAIQRVSAGVDAKLVRYFTYYKDLIEMTDEAFAGAIQDRLAQPALKDYLKRNVVTFKMIFEVPAEDVAVILARLSVKECAILFSQLEEPYRDSFGASFTAHKRELIMEELNFVSERPPSEISTLYAGVKEKIVTDLRHRNKKALIARSPTQHSLKIAS